MKCFYLLLSRYEIEYVSIKRMQNWCFTTGAENTRNRNTKEKNFFGRNVIFPILGKYFWQWEHLQFSCATGYVNKKIRVWKAI